MTLPASTPRAVLESGSYGNKLSETSHDKQGERWSDSTKTWSRLKQDMDNMLDMNGRKSGPGQVISRILNE